MRRARNSKFNPMTFNCDLDLQFAWLSYGFAHLALRCTSYRRLMKLSPRIKKIWSIQEVKD